MALTMVMVTSATGAPGALPLDVGDLPGMTVAKGSEVSAFQRDLQRQAAGDRAIVRQTTFEGASFVGARSGILRLDVAVAEFPSVSAARRALERARRAAGVRGSVQRPVGIKLGDRAWRAGHVVMFVKGSALARLRLKVAAGEAVSSLGLLAGKAQAARIGRVQKLSTVERLQSRLGPDGSASPRLALQMFAAIYGPIPGVNPGPRRSPKRPTELATGVIDGVRANFAKFTPVQQRAIVVALTRATRPRARAARSLGRTVAGCPPAIAHGTQPLNVNATDRATALRDQMKSLIVGAPGTWAVCVYDSPDSGADAIYDTLAFARSRPDLEVTLFDVIAGGSGPPDDACRTRIITPGLASDFLLAHEMVHCLAQEMGFKSMPLWKSEGIASWVPFQVVPPPFAAPRPSRYYLDWLDVANDAKPLFQRGYAAFGFFGLAQSVAGLTPQSVVPIWGASNEEAYRIAVGGFETALLSAWAPGLMGFSAPPGWKQAYPYEALSPRNLPELASEGPIDAAPYTVRRFDITDNRLAVVSRPIVEITANGHVRATDGKQDFVLGDAGPTTFCLGGNCACRDEDEPLSPFPAHTNVEARLTVAMTGGPVGANLSIVRHRYREYCGNSERSPGDQDRPPGPVEQRLVGKYVNGGWYDETLRAKISRRTLTLGRNGTWRVVGADGTAQSGFWGRTAAATVTITGGNDLRTDPVSPGIVPCATPFGYRWKFVDRPYARGGRLVLRRTLELSGTRDPCEPRSVVVGGPWVPSG